MSSSKSEHIVVLLPCLNEEASIADVIKDFKRELPTADIVVIDNASTDRTAEIARENGASVVYEPRRGKGFAVQTMFDKLEADYFVMADGDGTYLAKDVHKLLQPLREQKAQMVVGTRLANKKETLFRPFHRFGNWLVSVLINVIWQNQLVDIMSGYRAYTREVAKSLPLISAGFEIETEITLQMLDKDYLIVETPISYGDRPENSPSKLRTIPDGIRVIGLILRIFKDYKPLTFFGGIGLLLLGASFVSGYFWFYNLAESNQAVRLSFGVITIGLSMIAFLSATVGLVLTTVNWKLREIYSLIRRHETEKIKN